MIKIYHYSNADIKNKIKINCFGYNAYTDNSIKISGVKRIYFYLNKNTREYFFISSKFLYTAKINLKKLYNIKSDKIKLKNNQDIYNEAKKLGYKGLYGNGVIVLFYDVKFTSKNILHWVFKKQ